MARKPKQPKGKTMNPTYFVFCEGKTEAAYVDFLRRNFRIPIEIIARVSDSNINQKYIDNCKRDRFTTSKDKTFLMFDLDVRGMLEHLQKIKDAVLLVSNPCIEYWFLLHYGDVKGELTSAESLARLKRVVSDYAKGTFSKSMEKVLMEEIASAGNRARTKSEYANPSSTVYRLTDEIVGRLK